MDLALGEEGGVRGGREGEGGWRDDFTRFGIWDWGLGFSLYTRAG